MMRRAAGMILAAALLIAACGEPPAREQFIRSDGTGEYSFEVVMTDTLAGYNLSFYTAIDHPLMQPDTVASFPLQVVWRSPSGRYFSETVYYPADSLRARYRSGVVPSEPGTWELGVTIAPEPPGLRGLGLVCSKVVR